MSGCNQCKKCAHYENCGAGTKNCQSYVPVKETYRDEISRIGFRKELKEYKEAWDAYEFCAENSG